MSSDSPTVDVKAAGPADVRGPGSREIVLRARTICFALLGFLAALAITAVASDRSVGASIAKVTLPAVALGMLPGLLVTLFGWRGARWNLTEWLAAGIAISFGLVQLPTVIGLGFGIATSTMAAISAGLLAIAALALLVSNRPLVYLTVGRDELLALTAILAVAGIAYVKGSPFFADEEQIHLSVIRRIAEAPSPSAHNIHPVNGVVFTHPYPGTHYFMALATDLGRTDALFVYHKLRGWWTFASLLFLYVLARRIFDSNTMAAASLLGGIALVLNGCFADFFVIFWGQLAPFSHPSDVAMAVLLPGLLLLGLRYYTATDRREAAFFLCTAVVLGAMVTMVHIRETVQFLVYSGCLFLVTCLFAWDRVRARRIVVLCVLLCVIALGYGMWHKHSVQHIADYDSQVKAELIESLRHGTWSTLVGTPFPFHENTLWFSLFYGWNAVLILATPLVWLAMGKKPLVLMMGASVLAYLVILRFPVLSILYTYVTHAEMLDTPVRNFTLFLYLMTGPLLYVIACHPILAGTIAVGVAAGLGFATRLGWLFWLTHYDWLLMPAIGIHLLVGAVVLLCRTGPALRSADSASRLAVDLQWSWRPALLFTVLLAVAAGVSGMWERSLLSLHHITTYSPFLGEEAPTVRSPRHLLASLQPVMTPHWDLKKTNAAFADCPVAVNGNASVPPPAGLVRWAKRSLPADAVVASNGMNAYPLPVFLPQRVIAWPPIATFNVSYPKALSPAYYELFDQAAKKHRVQPFFDAAETAQERSEFLERTHPTHVVLDPPTYRELHRVMEGQSDRFEKVYDDGSWSVFAVH